MATQHGGYQCLQNISNEKRKASIRNAKGWPDLLLF